MEVSGSDIAQKRRSRGDSPLLHPAPLVLLC